MDDSRDQLKIGRDERGQLVVLFTLGMFTLLLFVSLSMNVGQAVVRRHQAQVLADTGALAGAAVQARGLNQITRVNAASLRLFNTLQLRSRVGGYHEWRVPLKSLLAALIADRHVQEEIEAEVPSSDKNKPGKTEKRDTQGLITRMLKIATAGIAKTRDDQDAFRNMEPWFAGLRSYMRLANFGWEIRARQVARDVTVANIGSLVGPRTAARCRSGGCVKPIFSMPGVKELWEGGKGLKGTFDAQRGSGNSKQAVKDWFTGLKDLRNENWLGLIESFKPFPRLVHEWENPNGDILIIRYWTDITDAERKLVMATVRTLKYVIPAFWPIFPLVDIAEEIINGAMTTESWLRRALAPKWHDMRVTLHRKSPAGGDDPFSQDTRFVFWVKLPTTPPSMRIFYPFADLPEITAVAVGKPVGGNVGAYPRAARLGKGTKGLGKMFEVIEQVLRFGEKILPENEHVYSLTPYGVRKVSRADKPREIREGVFKEEPGPKRMFEVYTAEELAKMGFDAKRLHSLFWYRAPQFPYYEPRLVPLQEAYMGDIDLDDDAQARLRELYGLKAKRKRPWPF